MSATAAAARPSLVHRVLSSPHLAPLNDMQALDDLLRQFNTIRSPLYVRARVLEIIDETPDTKTFVLKPNLRWRGFTPGQHTVVELEINGRRHHRTYTLTSDPAARGRVAITVKRQPGGRVSGHLHEQTRVGDILTLSAAYGDFVLETPPPRVLMLSAGSGITPMMALLRQLHDAGYNGELHFVHVCRSAADAIFVGAIQDLAERWPNLKAEWIHTAESGRPDMARLLANVTDAGACLSLLCGPQGFMDAVTAHWHQNGWDAQLRKEYFGAPPRTPVGDGVNVEVRCEQSGSTFCAGSGQPILAEAERAGLTVRSGCRIGVCRTCVYTKTSGVVQNLITGEISAEPDEVIQLCICAARSDLELKDL